MDETRGPWGPKKPPYDPSQDGVGPDGYPAWDLRTSLICFAAALGTALLFGWLVGGR